MWQPICNSMYQQHQQQLPLDMVRMQKKLRRNHQRTCVSSAIAAWRKHTEKSVPYPLQSHGLQQEAAGFCRVVTAQFFFYILASDTFAGFSHLFMKLFLHCFGFGRAAAMHSLRLCRFVFQLLQCGGDPLGCHLKANCNEILDLLIL